MLRKILFILSFVLSSAAVFAQENAVPITVEHEIAQPEFNTDLNGVELMQDSLHLPLLNSLGQMHSMNYLGVYPMCWGGFNNWQLHEGLNMSLGASVFAEFGKHARHGAGFSQQLAMQYAQPLTDKLSFSVGGYLTNVNWQHDSYRDAGLSAVLGYRFNEKWEGYVYGQKSLLQTNFMPMTIYDCESIGDRIGAAVKYNFSPAFSVQFSVEERKTPNHPGMPPGKH